MAKLKDDHIRWILDLDAKGVQGELRTLSSETLQLTKKNEELNKEMKAAEKQMKECLKEMKSLEKQGKESSDTYTQFENTLESTRADIEDYTRKIVENERKIKENNNQHVEIIKTMSLEDMTMSQLKQRASELQKQLDHTSLALSPEAYTQLSEELIQVKDRMEVVRKSTTGYLVDASLMEFSMKELREEAKDLQEQLDNTALATEPQKYKELQGQLDNVNKRMSEVKNANKSMLQQFAGMNHPVGTAAKSIQGFGQALKVLMANPVGLVIMVIVTAFTALYKAIKSSEEATHLLNQIMAPLKFLFDAILHVVQKLAVGFLEFVQAAVSGVTTLLAKIPGLENIMGKVNEKAKEAIQLEKDKQALQIRQREQLSETAKKELEIAKLRNQSRQRDKYSTEERMKMLDKAILLEKEISEEKVYQAKETLRLLELEARRNQNNTEMANKLAQAQANVYNAEREYYSSTLRMEGERSAAVLENRREAAEAAKQQLEAQLNDVDNAMNQEINLLKKARLAGELTEKDYNKKVKELTINALNEKINIKGQEKDKIVQLEQQLLDAQLESQANADKELLDSLRNELENKLQLLDSARNAQLEKLQEEESDRAIYALRASELESQTAEARLAVIREYGERLQEAEFQNNQTRIDAIEENGKDSIVAESESLKEREKLQKQFAKTTADFERQYNIKTWEQRREDELRILEKQRKEGLLSEETYQLAVTAVHKKYEDEKLKVREQYGIASMAELYNAEMEALLEQHEKGLLSEEEYEKAKLQIKLKYAQEYAQKAAEFAGMASDAISALQDAEIANTESKYDAEIAAAGDNKEEVERLEKEKAQEKLNIEKKYADVQFAVTAAEIVSSTAAGIMKTYGQLGWPAGIAAGILMGITGAAQLAVANAQRKKVKSMTLSGSGASSGPATGQIKLKEGFAEGGSNTGDYTDGGYTGDGDRYNVAGWVPYHSGEYFVAVPELKHPAVQDHIREIDKIRRKRTNKNPLPAGFADGGANMQPTGSTAPVQMDNTIARQLLGVLNDLKHGKVNINYGITELEAAQKTKNEYESKFDLQ